jgi:hypothetical protein
MLGKGEARMKECAKSDVVDGEEVTNVESTAVDSLLQLSGAMLKRNTTKPSASSGNRNKVDTSKEDDFQRRETRSASYSAAEAMLMMGTTSSKESPSVAEGNSRQSPPQEVFSNGSGQEKQPCGREKGEDIVPQKLSNLSKTPPRSLTISAEANDSDSEATLTPPTPAKRLPSLSVDTGMEKEAASGADSGSGMELKQTVGEPSPPSATIPDVLERTHQESTLNSVPESTAAMAPIEEKSSFVEASRATIHQPSSLEPQSVFASEEVAPPTSAVSAPDLSATSDTLNESSHNISSDIDDSLPPSKRFKLATEDKNEEEREVPPKTEHEPEPVFNKASPISQPDVIERYDESESSLKPNTEIEETHTSEISPVVQNPSSLDDNQLVMKVQEDDKVADGARSSPPSLVQEEAMNTEIGSPAQPSDKGEAEIDEISKEDDVLAEPAKPSPPSTDTVTSWSAFADVAQASYEEREQQQDSVVEKTSEPDVVKTGEESPSSPPPPPLPPPPRTNKNVEKLKVDISAKSSSVSSVSSPPFTPDPPIEVDVFDNLPPTPKLVSKTLESEAILKESHTTNHSDFSSSIPDKDKEKMQQSSGVAISTGSDSSSVNSISVSGGPQNRLVVNRPSPNRLQHRKHIGHSSKVGKDGKTESRKRARPPPDSQMRLFEVDTVSTTTTSTTTNATSATTPLAHTHTHLSHSSTKEKKVNSERASREDSHQQDDRHSSSSVRKLKKSGHSSSKSSLGGQKQSKHSSTGKYTLALY